MTQKEICTLQSGRDIENPIPCKSIKEARVLRMQLSRFQKENPGVVIATRKHKDADGNWDYLMVKKFPNP